MKYSRILLTDDGSPLAASAAPYAASIAHADGKVLIVRVAQDAGVEPNGLSAAVWSDGMGSARGYRGAAPQPLLHRVMRDFSERGAERVGSLVVRGDPKTAIPEVAHRVGAEIVVMASHGYSGLRRAVVGSVTDYVARHLGRIPVLVCHGVAPAERDPFRRIAVALDESLFAEMALDYARALVDADHGAIELIRVLDLHGTYISATVPWCGGPMHSEGASATSTTDRRARPINPADLVVPGLHLERVDNHDIGSAIMNAARSTHCGIIVMSSRGRGPVGRFFYGSISDEVARRFTCGAVLLVHPDAEPASLQWKIPDRDTAEAQPALAGARMASVKLDGE